jgi:ATP-binding cassette subfamily C protein CydC
MAACLVVAAVITPWLAARAVRAKEVAALQHHSARDVSTIIVLDHAPELRVSGRLDDMIVECERQQRDWGRAPDRAARPAAVASAAFEAITALPSAPVVLTRARLAAADRARRPRAVRSFGRRFSSAVCRRIGGRRVTLRLIGVQRAPHRSR